VTTIVGWKNFFCRQTSLFCINCAQYGASYTPFIYQMILSLIPKETAIMLCCFEMARQITWSIDLSWQPELVRYFKTEPSDRVVFCFGISENTEFSNAIDSVSFVLGMLVEPGNIQIVNHFCRTMPLKNKIITSLCNSLFIDYSICKFNFKFLILRANTENFLWIQYIKAIFQCSMFFGTSTFFWFLLL
jgi:hypothetical protein